MKLLFLTKQSGHESLYFDEQTGLLCIHDDRRIVTGHIKMSHSHKPTSVCMTTFSWIGVHNKKTALTFYNGLLKSYKDNISENRYLQSLKLSATDTVKYAVGFCIHTI